MAAKRSRFRLVFQERRAVVRSANRTIADAPGRFLALEARLPNASFRVGSPLSEETEKRKRLAAPRYSSPHLMTGGVSVPPAFRLSLNPFRLDRSIPLS
jgi:hypothetical protein